MGRARIIVIFTTNNKDMLNPTLLSRISVDIYMGHCCFEGFKVLASNYWGPLMSMMMSHTHTVYPDIKRLIDGQVITPAQITEELMKSEDVCHIPGPRPIFNDKPCPTKERVAVDEGEVTGATGAPSATV
ncbi:hypothetical protein F2Q69_00024409 [Brassica cretica]|uniref:AAA+ ATPase At3g28540-like C-terminal domain-containing protein n=1 Tax=Brassica cretica TaxID=69181 RepID=A0A8S9QLQ8_BRACR|nr:hypothetical protein F2Q69_00024409 [Brassica cretica]